MVAKTGLVRLARRSSDGDLSAAFDAEVDAREPVRVFVVAAIAVLEADALEAQLALKVAIPGS